jgi:mutator protein MutT
MSANYKNVIPVVAAVFNSGFSVLVFQRKNKDGSPGLWEFPGGKVETGESDEQALVREISEELDINIQVLELAGQVKHDYGEKCIDLRAYFAKGDLNQIKLNDHLSSQWCSINDLIESKKNLISLSEADFQLLSEIYAKLIAKPML